MGQVAKERSRVRRQTLLELVQRLGGRKVDLGFLLAGKVRLLGKEQSGGLLFGRYKVRVIVVPAIQQPGRCCCALLRTTAPKQVHERGVGARRCTTGVVLSLVEFRPDPLRLVAHPPIFVGERPRIVAARPLRLQSFRQLLQLVVGGLGAQRATLGVRGEEKRDSIQTARPQVLEHVPKEVGVAVDEQAALAVALGAADLDSTVVVVFIRNFFQKPAKVGRAVLPQCFAARRKDLPAHVELHNTTGTTALRRMVR